MANGQRYLDAVIPPQVIAQRLENEQTLMLANGSVIRFLSGDQPDRLRGLALLGAVADEFASWDTDEALRVMRPSLATHGGFLVVTSTPRGLNFYRDLWQTATGSPDWWCSTVTADDAYRDAEARTARSSSHPPRSSASCARARRPRGSTRSTAWRSRPTCKGRSTPTR